MNLDGFEPENELNRPISLAVPASGDLGFEPKGSLFDPGRAHKKL